MASVKIIFLQLITWMIPLIFLSQLVLLKRLDSISPAFLKSTTDMDPFNEPNIPRQYFEKECLSHTQVKIDATIHEYCAGRASQKMVETMMFTLRSLRPGVEEVIFGVPGKDEYCEKIIFDRGDGSILCAGTTKSDLASSTNIIHYYNDKVNGIQTAFTNKALSDPTGAQASTIRYAWRSDASGFC